MGDVNNKLNDVIVQVYGKPFLTKPMFQDVDPSIAQIIAKNMDNSMPYTKEELDKIDEDLWES